MSTPAPLVVRSHVARDLLQNAALFKTDKLVVWEYVSNGLQYVDPGTNPIVNVLLDSKRKRLTISDNGRGMDWQDLQNFFVMHGENVDRRQGRPGRGRFGTGKSAAFGIADVLRVITIKNGLRQIVELTRSEIAAMSEGAEIPVKVSERNQSIKLDNGTRIEIEGVHLKSLDQPGIINYIERHLAHWPKNCTVLVNNYECEYSEPPLSFERRFHPDQHIQQRLGDVVLSVKVSKVPLEPELRGISVYSNGVWHEITLAGSEGREMSQYIFGDLDVPALDQDASPIPPFDMSRSMRLNPSNELVQYLYAFVGRSVEQVRKELIEHEKQRKATEEARKLASQASEIAKLINEDFDAFKQRVTKMRVKARGAVDKLTLNGDANSESDLELLFGGKVPSRATEIIGDPGSSGDGSRDESDPPRNLLPQVEPDATGNVTGSIASPSKQAEKHTKGGGFGVNFKNMGVLSHRAQYAADERTIYINLDHPQLSAALGSLSIDDPEFRRLAYEVAFAEYAIALASELNARDEYIDTGEPIFDIRETLNRLARRAALLYGAT